MEYLHNNRDLFFEAVITAADAIQLNPKTVEKDYYISIILRMISQYIPFAVFKGGTSLSKCYQVINRFSEDIDITVDSHITAGQKEAVKTSLARIAGETGLKISNFNSTRSRRDFNRYEFSYNSVFEDLSYRIVSNVLIEVTYTAISFPTIEMLVHNYIGDMLAANNSAAQKHYRLEPFTMKIQSLSRTFIDNVFALCDYYLQKKEENHSRHLYDLYKLEPLMIFDNTFAMLVKEVRTLRSGSPNCPSANQSVNIPELLIRIAEEDAYKDDYQRTTIPLFRSDCRDDYDKAKSVLLKIACSGMF